MYLFDMRASPAGHGPRFEKHKTALHKLKSVSTRACRRYCSREHQAEDWERHKLTCREPVRISQRSSS